MTKTTIHTQDEECGTIDEMGCCSECGVGWGDPCMGCGGRAFHRPGCADYVAEMYQEEYMAIGKSK